MKLMKFKKKNRKKYLRGDGSNFAFVSVESIIKRPNGFLGSINCAIFSSRVYLAKDSAKNSTPRI